MITTVRAGPDRNQELRTQKGLPCGWQGPNHPSHLLAASEGSISKKLELEAQSQNLNTALQSGMYTSKEAF